MWTHQQNVRERSFRRGPSSSRVVSELRYTTVECLSNKEYAAFGRRDGDIILHPKPTRDPNDPLNWSKGYKALNFSMVCLYTLLVFVKLDIGTVVWGATSKELGFSLEANNWSYGFNCLGLAFGCMILILFSLKYGRRPIFLVSVATLFAATVWSANMRTTGDLWGSNIISGLVGAVSETMCQMTISDVFFVHQRATANGMFLIMLNTGAFLGPVAAGYSATSQGWPWPFWWTAIFLGVLFFLFLFLFEETKYIPVTQRALAPTLTNSSQTLELEDAEKNNEDRAYADMELQLALEKTTEDDLSASIPRKPYVQRLALLRTSPGYWGLLEHVYLPFVILFTVPVITYTAILYGSTLAWFAVIVSVYSSYFTYPPYNFDSSAVGLMSLAPFIGCIFGAIYGGPLNDRLIIRLARRNRGIYEPEMRLWLALPMLVLLPGSILMFGLTTTRGLPWIVPAIGAAIYGFCLTAVSDPVLTYGMDSCQEIIGDSFIAITFVRNGFATAITFGLTAWIDRVGLDAVFYTCAGVGFLIVALTVPMIIWGKELRRRSADRLRMLAGKQFGTRG